MQIYNNMILWDLHHNYIQGASPPHSKTGMSPKSCDWPRGGSDIRMTFFPWWNEGSERHPATQRFGRSRISGTMSYLSSWQNICPSVPKPVWISSNISSALTFVAPAAWPFSENYSFPEGLFPASPEQVNNDTGGFRVYKTKGRTSIIEYHLKGIRQKGSEGIFINPRCP